MKVIKKPFVVDAFEILSSWFDVGGTNLTHTTISVGALWMGVEHTDDGPVVVVNTLEGKMRGRVGDFLMIGIKGEPYIVRRDIFFETYEDAQ